MCPPGMRLACDKTRRLHKPTAVPGHATQHRQGHRRGPPGTNGKDTPLAKSVRGLSSPTAGTAVPVPEGRYREAGFSPQWAEPMPAVAKPLLAGLDFGGMKPPLPLPKGHLFCDHCIAEGGRRTTSAA